MKSLCEELSDHVSEIVMDWEGVTRTEPWLLLPKGYGIDHLPEVAEALIEAAICAPKRQEAQRKLIRDSAKHGHDRREQQFGQDNVLVEYQLLRAAMEILLRRVAGPERAARALIQVDAAISIATRASLFGYHRAELEKSGRWPAILDELVGESPLPEAGAADAAAPR